MSSENQNSQPEEIELGVLFQKINNFFGNIAFSIFKGILYIRRNIIIFLVLIISGIVLGYFLDVENKDYNSEIIVSPNFGSTDYLYSKIDLISSKINERDYRFLKSIGIKNPEVISSIKIEPVIDIYNFVNSSSANLTNAQNTQNFELVKLLSESGDINKVIKDNTTSKNYPFQTIKIATSRFVSKENTITPLLNFLNKSDYFENIQKTYLSNTSVKLQKNQEVISQIDAVLNEFSNKSNSDLKNDKLIYYNENTQLNEIIKNKTNLTDDIANLKLQLINFKKTINDVSNVLNIKNTKGTNGKMKIVLPFLFVLIFIFFALFKAFYKKQAAKLNK